jgi:hypothetical protein
MARLGLDALRIRGRGQIEQALVRLGERAGSTLPRLVNGAGSFLETGRLLREAGFVLPRPARSRLELFDAAIALVTSASHPLYLEFGVWQGASITYVSTHLPAPAARFIGFDSFEGLPDDWTPAFARGTFSTSGAAPPITDGRVSYVRGWFSDTLPQFVAPHHDRLIVNIDCDIYSSAAAVLSFVGPLLSVGDLLYFDEFNDRLHEGRAFHEFRISSGHRYRLVALTRGASQILFERMA